MGEKCREAVFLDVAKGFFDTVDTDLPEFFELEWFLQVGIGSMLDTDLFGLLFAAVDRANHDNWDVLGGLGLLEHAADIKAFEQQYFEHMPWLK